LYALIKVRATVLRSLRLCLEGDGFEEVTASSIVNFAGSCENPYASFPIEVYGKTAYLTQSAQLQLEPIVLRLRQRVFTQATSFRAEDYQDPESPGRRLSEFTLLEAETPFLENTPDHALELLLSIIENVVKKAIEGVLRHSRESVALLGGDIEYLLSVLEQPFARITWDAARSLLGHDGSKLDFGIKEERRILAHFGNSPVFLVEHPSDIKFFNMKRTRDGLRCFSADLLLPPLGETVGAGLREQNVDNIVDSLLNSKLGAFLVERQSDPVAAFRPYLDVVREEAALPRGGFGLGFERFVAFLIGSNDILETVLDKTAARVFYR
jgi:asparaginyl-tRNA synthetase